MKKLIILLSLLLAASCTSFSSLEKKRFADANVYINSHLDLNELNRIAILEGMVILGMNPCESIAAVGEPYDVEVKIDPTLPKGISASDVISKQCKEPDKSIVIFYYNNSFQYGKRQSYAVTYIRGEAAKIERGAVKAGSPEGPEK